MKKRKGFQWLIGVTVIVLLSSFVSATAVAKEIKIGVIFDYTGPYAAGDLEVTAAARPGERNLLAVRILSGPAVRVRP